MTNRDIDTVGLTIHPLIPHPHHTPIFCFTRCCLCLCLSIGILVSGLQSVWAGSFRIYDQSASAAGQASAFVAQADDASAGYYNPAGMTQLHGMQFSLGTTLIGGGFDFRNAAGQSAHGDLMGAVAKSPPPRIFMRRRI